jgi:hypothetical protein
MMNEGADGIRKKEDTHSRTWYYLQYSEQLQVTADLTSEKSRRYQCDRRLGGPQIYFRRGGDEMEKAN